MKVYYSIVITLALIHTFIGATKDEERLRLREGSASTLCLRASLASLDDDAEIPPAGIGRINRIDEVLVPISLIASQVRLKKDKRTMREALTQSIHNFFIR